MSTTAVAPSRTVDERAAVIAGHPRGRGFGILSRLARTDDTVGRHVREDATEEHATVLTFERRSTSPRHRRDDLLVGALLNYG
jgi:hypothetical protein